MVKVVNTEISLDGFKRRFGRKPTEEELGKMMLALAKRESEGTATGTNSAALSNSKIHQDIARKAIALRHKDKNIAVNKRAWGINKMLLAGLAEADIVDALLISPREYHSVVRRFNLPRKDIVLKSS